MTKAAPPYLCGCGRAALGAVSVVLWEVLTTALLAMTPCGWLATMQLILKAAQIIMLLNAVIQMIDLAAMYAKTGNIYYSQELSVQVAACATLSIATKLLGSKLTELKEKVGVHNYEFLYSNKQSLYCK